MIALRVLLALAALGMLGGCSTFGSRQQTLVFGSDPPAAEVLVNGKIVGVTPMTYEARRGEKLAVEIRKAGYQTAFRAPGETLSGIGILDLCGGAVFLVPFLGLISDAAWEYSPSSFGVTLEPAVPTVSQ